MQWQTQDHRKKVKSLTKQISQFYTKQTPFRIYHGSTNATRPLAFDATKMVDVSQFSAILALDQKNRTVVVEPNVPMDRLVAATLQAGLLPPVVMEFPGITVGGGVQGGAGESSSFKYGTFNRTINWYEMVLANGEVIKTSPKEHPDLYWATAGSYGTLGVITAAEVQLIPAKPYVALEYSPVRGIRDAIAKIQHACSQQPDYIDAILFSKSCGVVMVGTLQDTFESSVHRFTRAFDPWFYLHAKQIATAGRKTSEHIPLTDYLFRYDRGAFWMGTLAFERFRTLFTPLTRFVLNPLLKTRRMYTALQASNASQQYIIQDLALPLETVSNFLTAIDKSFGIYPLWLCPLLPETKSAFLSNALATDLVINVGVWGKFRGNYPAFVAANKALEAQLTKLGGKKWLYAHAYYDEATFWRIYGGKQAYDAIRAKYHAQYLPTVYEKVHVTRQHEIHAKRGLFAAVLGKSGITIRR